MDDPVLSTILKRGRLRGTSRAVTRFISSLDQDKRIAGTTVLVNEAHVIALAKAHIISRDDAKRLLKALSTIQEKIPARKDAEDIHVLIEEYVTKRVGRRIGGQLHTGKSRNDQVATAIRMALREAILEVSGLILILAQTLLKLGKSNTRALFVGYTHLQPAQPITFAHYLLAIEGAMARDNERLMQAYHRINMSPMGSGALAGSSFPIDRWLVANLLGFDGLVENSLDAVSSRDFVLESLSCCGLLASNISRIAADLIFYSSADVGMITLPEEYSSTSSIMPQKKNPDPLELIRARSALVTGNVSSSLTMIHGLHTGYNLDFQELTPILWQSFDVTSSMLRMMIKLLPRIKIDKSIGEKKAVQMTVATEISNLLAREENISFREAHRIVGTAVRRLIEEGQSFTNLSEEDWKPLLEIDLKPETIQALEKVSKPTSHVWVYRTIGSSSPEETMRMLKSEERNVKISFSLHDKEKRRLDNATKRLLRMVTEF